MSETELAQLEQLGVSQDDLAMLQTFTGILVVVTLISIVLTLWQAKRKRLNTGFWLMMALLFGPLALLAVFFASAKSSTEEGPL